VIEKAEAPATGEALLTFDERSAAWRRSIPPWRPLETRALAWTSSRLVAVANDADGKSHVFVAPAPDAVWSELVGWGDGATSAELLLAGVDDIVVGFQNKSGLEIVRVGL
jgi:hypothetical protein